MASRCSLFNRRHIPLILMSSKVVSYRVCLFANMSGGISSCKFTFFLMSDGFSLNTRKVC